MLITSEKTVSLSGVYQAAFRNGAVFDLKLPGTLDESNIGYRDTPEGKVFSVEPESEEAEEAEFQKEGGLMELTFTDTASDRETVTTRYKRKYRFEGAVSVSQAVTFSPDPDKRLFLEAERVRDLRLFLDDEEIEPFTRETLVTPAVFEVTGKLDGTHVLRFLSDNSYEDLPADAILSSDTASQDTQTNWNGILGYFRLREEEPAFLESLRVIKTGETIRACAVIESLYECREAFSLYADILEQPLRTTVSLHPGLNRITFGGLKTSEEPALWEAGDPFLYEFSAVLGRSEKKLITGFRELSCDEDGRFMMNGHRLFLRGCREYSVFPETGHEPTDYESYKRIFEGLKSYGINWVSFVSHCPPDAAFSAADDQGVLLSVSLSQAGTDGFSDSISKEYFRKEAEEILAAFSDHPSFCFLDFGDDLTWTEEGKDAAASLAADLGKKDPTRLYLTGAGEDDLTFVRAFKDVPDTVKKPVIYRGGGFLMPADLKEIDLFSGFLEPENLTVKKKMAEAAGQIGLFPKYVGYSGMNAVLNTRIEAETVLSDPRFSGILLEGLTDCPGKGGHFFGMMNSHRQIKAYPFADPAQFKKFFSDSVLFALPGKVSLEFGETTEIPVYFYNNTKETQELKVTAVLESDLNERSFELEPASCGPFGLTEIGKITLAVTEEEGFDPEVPMNFNFRIKAGRLTAQYPIFIYPCLIPVCPLDIMEADAVTPEVESFLKEGGTVFFTPPADEKYLPGSAQCRFGNACDASRDASGLTFGSVIEADHPIFDGFPAEAWADRRWENLSAGRAVFLKKRYRTMIGEMADPDKDRRGARLFECRVLNGNVLFSSLGLKEQIVRPEARALLKSIYDYMDSFEFLPTDTMSLAELKEILVTG